MTGPTRDGGSRRPPDSELFPVDPDFADVVCPDCAGHDIEVASLFGSTTSEVLFRCISCHSLFNWVKWRHQLPPVPARRAGATA
ncbi:MAG: hypothetical protein GEV07_20415 [Streptosporangiales bacterium]|nr:hypothetical protein [Streptosporangiales bacterium]